jgi:hypothetical protein
MALPSSNITTAMVANELGEGTNNVVDLCTSDEINMWSRCKPVPMSAAERLTNLNHWQRGADGMSGLSVSPVSGSTLDFLKTRANVENIANRRWTYRKPSGGALEPYCLGDFRRYDADATNPFYRPSSYYLNTFSNSGSNFSFNCYADGGSGDNIQMSEMPGINWNNIYFVAVVFRGSLWQRTFQSVESVLLGIPPSGDVSGLNNYTTYAYDVFLLLRDVVGNKFYPFVGFPGSIPFKKEYNNPLEYSNQSISWLWNGTYKTFTAADADNLGTNAPTLQSYGTFVYKVRVTNPTSSSIALRSSDFSFWGTSAFNSYFSDETVRMRNSSGSIVSAITIPAKGYVDVMFEPLNNILLWNGYSYSGSYQSSDTSVEIGLNYYGENTQTFLYLTFNYRYTTNSRWV